MEESGRGGICLSTTLIADEIVRDESLPLEALGLYTYISVAGKNGQIVPVSSLGRLSRPTMQKYLGELADRGLISLVRAEGRGAPAAVMLVSAQQGAGVRYLEQLKAQLAAISARLRKGDDDGDRSWGEALMRAWLDLLVISREFADPGRPGFMVNPRTGEKLEYDRWYTALKVAFEFQGDQHYGATERFPDAEKAKTQQLNDLVKIGLSKRNGTELVEVESWHLAELGRMLEVLPKNLPRRDLKGFEAVVSYLEQEGRSYHRTIWTRRRRQKMG